MKQITSVLLGLCFVALISCGNAEIQHMKLPEVVKNTTGYEQWDTPVRFTMFRSLF